MNTKAKLVQDIIDGKDACAVVGLGYVGLPLAVAFSKKVQTIGFDINSAKVQSYVNGHDVTKEVGDEAIKACKVAFTSDPADIRKASFVIIAVPTPVNRNNIPDLSPVEGASRTVGRNLKKGAIVVYESTVYPGVTEDICIPILEKESGMKCGVDFKIGYSPERINPGDRVHRLESITKIVSGMDQETLDAVADMYSLVVEAGVYRASSIKVAEAAKVIENSQRDINIAFVNELSMIFNLMGIDTAEVLKAAGTKWNFLNFSPGLVGGHCIGVDPYYLTYKAQELGYQPAVILSGRRINDNMGKYVAENAVKQMIKGGISIKGSRVLVLGLTFKENVPDVRNTKVIDIIHELMEYGVEVLVSDPEANHEEVRHEYGLELVDYRGVGPVDAVLLAVAHDEYRKLTPKDLKAMLQPESNVCVDIKGVLDRDAVLAEGLTYWSL